MENQDFFLEIAKTKHPIDSTDREILPLPEMYGKNLIFKTGGVDGCNCAETLRLIENGKIDTTPLITHTYPLRKIAAAYELFENRRDGVIKVAIQTALS